jgi:non-heme chloroperoxidase
MFLKVGTENSTPIQLYYEDHGYGQPVVLIHGYPLQGTAWEKQTRVLLENGFRVITYDRRGFGKSSQPAIGYDYDTFAADLSKLMEKLHLANCVLVGHSMGTGEITRYLAVYGHQKISKVVFIAPVPPFQLKIKGNPSGATPASVFKGFVKQIDQDRYRFFMDFLHNFFNYDVLGGTLVSEEALKAHWNVAVAASPISTRECVATWATDFRPDLKHITVPSLIIQGDEDRILPFQASAVALTKMVPGSKLVRIPGGPHGIPWTHADQVNTALLAFLTTE